MRDTCSIREGQWVRFYFNGELRIAEVRYVRRSERWPNKWECLTTQGVVNADDVLEAR